MAHCLNLWHIGSENPTNYSYSYRHCRHTHTQTICYQPHLSINGPPCKIFNTRWISPLALIRRPSRNILSQSKLPFPGFLRTLTVQYTTRINPLYNYLNHKTSSNCKRIFSHKLRIIASRFQLKYMFYSPAIFNYTHKIRLLNNTSLIILRSVADILFVQSTALRKQKQLAFKIHWIRVAYLIALLYEDRR